MSVASILSLGTSIIGGIAGLLGSDKADLQARQAMGEELAFRREALGFSMQQYEEWKKTYGVVEKQLSDYYVNNNGQMQMDTAANIIEKSFRNVPAEVERIAEQRGLGEAQKGAMLSNMLVSKAESKAAGRISAGEQFRAEKSSFVAGGRGAQAQATSGIMNSYNAMAQMMGNRAATYKQEAAAGGAAAYEALSSGIAGFIGLSGGEEKSNTETNPQAY